MTVERGIDTPHSTDARLLAVLRTASNVPELSYAAEPVPLTGGFWAELLAFSLASPPQGWPADLVARLMPDAAVARKETIVQAAVAAAGYPTPAIRASGGPADGLGRAFMVMDRAAGVPLLPDLSGAGLATMLRRAASIPDLLAAAMADLHAIDPQPVRDQLTGLADAPVTLTALLTVLVDWAASSRRPDLVCAGQWLIDNPRQPTSDVICHGDLHPFNMIASGREVTVLDWSASLLAPRPYDVAFTATMLGAPPISVASPLRPLVRQAGRLLARRFLRRYEARAAVAISRQDLRWHQAVFCLRALTEMASWVHEGIIEERAGHPWLVSGPALAVLIADVTGVGVRPR